MLLNLSSFLILCISINASASIFKASEEEVPTKKPFKLPTFNEHSGHYNDHIPALIEAPMPNADKLYQLISNCYPAQSNFNIDVDLKAQITSDTSSIIGGNDNFNEISTNYVAIVAKMPLYSASERQRARDKEYDRRMDLSGYVSNFIQSLAKRNHYQRSLALYTALEKRSQMRVVKGLTKGEEQVGYLEKIIVAQEKFITAKAKVMENKLALVGQCRENQQQSVLDYLTKVINQ